MPAISGMVERLSQSMELRWRLLILACLVFGGMMIGTGAGNDERLNWYLLYVYGGLLIMTAQLSDSVPAFFTGRGASFWDHVRYYVRGDPASARLVATSGEVSEQDPLAERVQVGFWTLMPSAFISWIFAKSIENAAVLGGYYGVMGGVGYAAWYTSFFTAAVVGYVLRTKHGFTSLPQAIERCYGPGATVCFSLALLFRLWNEIWSNSVVVAAFYGPVHSAHWWLAVLFSTAIPAVYVMMGGMRASLFSDQLQALLGVIFLFIILGLIGGEMPGGINAVWTYAPPGGWLDGGSTLLACALLQGMVSYPFHDPVLTDRAFLSRPRTMVAAFVVGGAIAGTFIILFSAVGIFGCYLEGAVKNGSPSVMSKALSSAAFAFTNLVMMTSSMSTLDSTFTSCAKLVALELGGWLRLPGDARPAGQRGVLSPTDTSVTLTHLAIGRVSIVLLAVAGTLNLLANTEALSATTVSGTMVMGLGPPVYLLLFWRFASPDGARRGWPQAPLAFLLSFLPGLVFGGLYSVATTKAYPSGALRYAEFAASLEPLHMGVGSYSLLLGLNVIGHAVCLAGCVAGLAIHFFIWRLPAPVGESTTEHPTTGRRIPVRGYEAKAEAGPKAAAPLDSDRGDAGAV